MSIEGWLDKENVVYACNGLLFGHNKDGNLGISNNMNESWGYDAKWNKSEKDKYQMISLTCEIWKIQQTSEYSEKEADSDTEN